MSPFLSGLLDVARLVRDDLNGDDQESQVSFRGQKINAIVNHSPNVKWMNGEKDRKNPQFLPDAFSSVRVLMEDLDNVPKVGEFFTEQDGATHRIQRIDTYRLSWLCLCKHTAG